jgi:hypothetical protein
MKTIKISDDITYSIELNVFIHSSTGFIISADSVLIMSFDELSDRMYAITKTWLGINNYVSMKEFINNVETIYT